MDDVRNWIESQEFYELMQAYRHAPVTNQSATIKAFEAVKAELLRRLDAPVGRFGELEIRGIVNTSAIRIANKLKLPYVVRWAIEDMLLKELAVLASPRPASQPTKENK